MGSAALDGRHLEHTFSEALPQDREDLLEKERACWDRIASNSEASKLNGTGMTGLLSEGRLRARTAGRLESYQSAWCSETSPT